MAANGSQRRAAGVIPRATPVTLVAWAAIIALIAMMGGAAGCVDIDGGAVEVSWAIFSRDGRAINDCACASPRVSFVRLHLESVTDSALQPCAGVNACRFSCGRKTGATPFMIPPGQYLMSLVPLGTDGTDIAAATTTQDPRPSVQRPAPQWRSVVRGQPTQLEAFMLEADCESRCRGAEIFAACTAG